MFFKRPSSAGGSPSDDVMPVEAASPERTPLLRKIQSPECRPFFGGRDSFRDRSREKVSVVILNHDLDHHSTQTSRVSFGLPAETPQVNSEALMIPPGRCLPLYTVVRPNQESRPPVSLDGFLKSDRSMMMMVDENQSCLHYEFEPKPLSSAPYLEDELMSELEHEICMLQRQVQHHPLLVQHQSFEQRQLEAEQTVLRLK